MASQALHLGSTDAANALLAHDPLAMLLGMQLDQQIPMEKAFTSPSVLAQRLGVEPGGHLDAAVIAALPPDTLLDHWGGDAANVWAGVGSGTELVRRIAGLPGFGDQKARIFAALLAKQFGVTPEGWQEATGDYGQPGHRSIADVVDDASRVKVRSEER